MTSTRTQRQPLQAFVPFLAVCDLLGIHSNTGYTHRRDGTFPIEVIQIGGRFFCRRVDVDAFTGEDSNQRIAG